MKSSSIETSTPTSMKIFYAITISLAVAFLLPLKIPDSRKEMREKWGNGPRTLTDKQGVKWVVRHHSDNLYTIERKGEEE